MAYHELIKNFSGIREYIREFYVYGFRHRLEVGGKSARSYDNERRRVESWLGEYMHFGHDADGKRVYLSVDSRKILRNPLYKAFKTKSFTDNTVMLHFYLMDSLSETKGISLNDLIEKLDSYPGMGMRNLDESTIRKKLKEYEALGLVIREKNGRENVYSKMKDQIRLDSWKTAISFFSETAPLGVVGSYLLDKFENTPELFRYKHHHILNALDSEVLYPLLEAISEKKEAKLKYSKIKEEIVVVPYRIYCSTWYGRQYLLCWNKTARSMQTLRLDRISRASAGKTAEDLESLKENFEQVEAHLWGVSLKSKQSLTHLEFDLHLEENEGFVAERLEREKRCGTVRQLDAHTWRFSADLYDVLEVFPWIRTFIGRIKRFSCEDPFLEQRFLKDMRDMMAMYDGKEGEDTDAFS